MSFATFRSEVETEFKTKFETAYPNIPVSYQNFRLPPETIGADTWVRFSIQMIDSGQIDLGCKLFETVGRLQIQIFEPDNSGMSQTDEIADWIADLFAQNDLNIQFVQFTGITPISIGKDGDWYQTLVTVDFTLDSFR